MLFLVGALTVAVATALLRWSQPVHAPVQPAASAEAQHARAVRRTALRSSRAARRKVSQPQSVPAMGAWADREPQHSAEEPTLDLWNAAMGVNAIEEYLRLLQSEVTPEPEPEPEPEPAAAVEPVPPVEPAPSREVSAFAQAAAAADDHRDDEARRDDEAWERLFGMLRPSDDVLSRARGVHDPQTADRTTVPSQRIAEPTFVETPTRVTASVGATGSTALASAAEVASQTERRVRRCGVCREPGHDRRRCPSAASA